MSLLSERDYEEETKPKAGTGARTRRALTSPSLILHRTIPGWKLAPVISFKPGAKQEKSPGGSLSTLPSDGCQISHLQRAVPPSAVSGYLGQWGGVWPAWL